MGVIRQPLNKTQAAAVIPVADPAAIPPAQVQADWTATSGMGSILHKPSLAAVATSGAYADLSGKPTLATVAGSGAYADLTGKPTIPAAPVQSDWTEGNTSSLAFIANKPSLVTGAVRVFNNAPSRSLVTLAAAGNGFQLSASRDALASYSLTASVVLALLSSSYAVLEVAATNSAVAANWKEVARQSFPSTLGLLATQGSQMQCLVQAGWFLRIRTVGNLSWVINSGQEVLI